MDRELFIIRAPPPTLIPITACSFLTMACSIPANPDISGIGVRVAIYIQNILSFVPAFYSLMNDTRVDKHELKTTKDISLTILITAFAILISTVIQAMSPYGLSAFHASVILNLSWMNNTNTFIYFILWVHYRSHTPREDRIEPTWSGWRKHILSQLPWRRHSTCYMMMRYVLLTGCRRTSRS
jgi:hypothetical protein